MHAMHVQRVRDQKRERAFLIRQQANLHKKATMDLLLEDHYHRSYRR